VAPGDLPEGLEAADDASMLILAASWRWRAQVGVSDDGFVFHAMPAREKFLRRK